MKIKKDDLPTEGVKIQGIHFLPGKSTTVSKELGKFLTDNSRKGFVEVREEAKDTNKKKGVSEDG